MLLTFGLLEVGSWLVFDEPLLSKCLSNEWLFGVPSCLVCFSLASRRLERRYLQLTRYFFHSPSLVYDPTLYRLRDDLRALRAKKRSASRIYRWHWLAAARNWHHRSAIGRMASALLVAAFLRLVRNPSRVSRWTRTRALPAAGRRWNWLRALLP